ncbi:unnamed protein product [Rotaria sordida]|uniref:Uncharacterized protein n=1 Tax=Rotaria sordida TaxID=392033 RepID=A0A815JVN7_9BILA|nr:unnamed protein product [Rotaria sordida]CAF3957203.1 unnamed protein product [Rotaria sordida]
MVDPRSPLDRARRVVLETGLEHLEHVPGRIWEGMVWITIDSRSPLDRARRVVLGTGLEHVRGRIWKDFNDKILSRICDKILCRIYNQINTLTVEQYSIKRILRAANYPQLYSLSLVNFEEEILNQYLTDDSILRDLLSKQITHLNIDIKNGNRVSFEITSKIFVLILSLCKNLIDLNFCDLFFERKHWNHISDLT